jgi:hypothetical protein
VKQHEWVGLCNENQALRKNKGCIFIQCLQLLKIIANNELERQRNRAACHLPRGAWENYNLLEQQISRPFLRSQVIVLNTVFSNRAVPPCWPRWSTPPDSEGYKGGGKVRHEETLTQMPLQTLHWLTPQWICLHREVPASDRPTYDTA